jgi:hypothetical protein
VLQLRQLDGLLVDLTIGAAGSGLPSEEADMSNALRKLRRQADKYDSIPLWVKHATSVGPKLSERVIDVAKPLLDSARNEDDYRLSIVIATACWNLALMPKDRRPALVQDLLDESVKPGESSLDVERMIADIVARKEALYPDDKRIILDYTFVGGGKTAEFFVKYATDQPPPGAVGIR